MNDGSYILHLSGGACRLAPYDDGMGGTYVDMTVELPEEVSEVSDGYHLVDVVMVDGTAMVESVQTIETPEVKVQRQRGAPVGILQLGNRVTLGPIPGTDPNAVPSLQQKKDIAALGLVDDTVVWLMDGGRQRWVADHPKPLAWERSCPADARNGGLHFVNPYTFVPLPARVVRSRPNGHDVLGEGNLSGWFDWQLTLVTPLILPIEATPVADEIVRYPGSSLRGALRSLHETLAGGCLRIVDADFVPVHREPMNVFTNRERLCVVEAVEGGRVTKVRVADEVVWVDVERLSEAFQSPDEVYSGMRVSLDLAGKETVLGRQQQSTPGAVRPDGDWAVHLTHGGARSKKKHYFVAMGRIDEDDSSRVVTVTPEAWSRYQSACADSSGPTTLKQVKDSSPYPPGSPQWPSCDVTYTYADGRRVKVGRSRLSDGYLAVGDTVWLTEQGDLKMAAIWRRHGEHPVKDRLPDPSLLPCSDPDDLCPSCAVFGSIDPNPGTGEQRSYGSHVRVGFATTPPVTTTSVGLPPLRSPHPSAGGFYLKHEQPTSKQYSPSKTEGHIPRSQWGSALDRGGNSRQIAGRKYYWHGQDAGDETGRHRVRQHPAEQNGSGTQVPAGTVLTARVWFENLTRAQLGMLLAAAHPGGVLGHEGKEYGIHLGRGKPLGFGTATTAVTGLHAHTAAARYGGAAQEPVDADALLAETRQSMEHDEGLKPCWDGLRNALQLGFVPADRIWYPPGAGFQDRDTDIKGFDESFRWFSKHSGGRSGRLHPLPDVRVRNQYLPIEEEQ